MASPDTDLSLRPIDAATQLAFIAERGTASFLQTPAWAAVKSEWGHECLGWFAGERLVGVGLVLYRRLPRSKRCLAYLPEGPVIDWTAQDLGAWLRPLTRYLKKQGAFGVRIGPPVITARWSAAQVKDGLADPELHRLTNLPPAERNPVGAHVVAQLLALGWRSQSVAGGFAAGQPQFNFHVLLTDPDGDPLGEAGVLARMNQLWRRNIKKADKSGVIVSVATSASLTDDLAAFHALYVHTADRDGFTPRPLSYFQRMYAALSGEDPDRIKLYLARHEDSLVASTIAIRVGTHVWYSYGASSTEKREVRGSNAVQWAMLRDAIAAGATVYDMRGITETLASDDSHVGLIQFKVGTGGEAVEYVGEWDLPLNRMLYKAFEVYLRRRSA